MPVQFTVVIPTHDRREQLLQAVRSVQAQTRAALQIIIVGDGCTDGSLEAVDALGDPLIEILDLPKAPRWGWGHRNEALRRACDDVISYLGDDDLYLPDHLEHVGMLHDTGRFDVVQAMTVMMWPDGRLEPYALDWGVACLREEFLAGLCHKNPMASISHRRGVAEAAGGWSPIRPVRGTSTCFGASSRGGPPRPVLRAHSPPHPGAARGDGRSHAAGRGSAGPWIDACWPGAPASADRHRRRAVLRGARSLAGARAGRRAGLAGPGPGCRESLARGGDGPAGRALALAPRGRTDRG